MDPLTKHPRPLGLTLLLLLGTWGCAHAPNPDVPGTWRIASAAASWRESLGPGITVGLLTHGRTLNLMGAQPATREQAADKGARAVGAALFSAARSMEQPNEVTVPSFAATLVGHFVVAPTAFSLLVPGTLAAVGVGALVPPSAGRVAAAEATLTQAWDELQSATALQRHLVTDSREQRGLRLVPLSETILRSPDDANDQIGNGPAAMETILVVLGPRANLTSTEGVEQVNPRLALVLTVRVLLLRRTDGTVLYDAQVEKEGAEAHTFTAWAANNAQPLRDEVDRASASLGKQIVGQLFGAETF